MFAITVKIIRKGLRGKVAVIEMHSYIVRIKSDINDIETTNNKFDQVLIKAIKDNQTRNVQYHVGSQRGFRGSVETSS